jgi:hypothetical protein
MRDSRPEMHAITASRKPTLEAWVLTSSSRGGFPWRALPDSTVSLTLIFKAKRDNWFLKDLQK